MTYFHSRYEQAYLTSLLSARHGLYWTDVSDLHNPGMFTYSQGQHDVTYTNWAPSMPGKQKGCPRDERLCRGWESTLETFQRKPNMVIQVVFLNKNKNTSVSNFEGLRM